MKPFIKWVGGKTQIIEDVLGSFPTKIDDYHEVFVGGGSVLLSVLSKGLANGKVCAYDLNGSLIALYQNIQTQPDVVHKHLQKMFNEYDKCLGTEINREPKTLKEAKQSKENYYYWMRKKFNSNKEETPQRSAMFIFLNKTCFRGVYREGPNGFNVPYGHYKTTPMILTKKELSKVSDLIKDVDSLDSVIFERRLRKYGKAWRLVPTWTHRTHQRRKHPSWATRKMGSG